MAIGIGRRQFISVLGGAARIGIALAFTAPFIMWGAAQDFMAPSGAPAEAFPKPKRPVADIVSPIWRGERERDAAGEPRQLVRLLGIKPGMTVADIGAGSGYYVCGWRPSSDPTGASLHRMSCQNICEPCAIGCAISDCKTSLSASVSRTIRGCQLICSTRRSWCTCTTKSHNLMAYSTILRLRLSPALASGS